MVYVSIFIRPTFPHLPFETSTATRQLHCVHILSHTVERAYIANLTHSPREPAKESKLPKSNLNSESLMLIDIHGRNVHRRTGRTMI